MGGKKTGETRRALNGRPKRGTSHRPEKRSISEEGSAKKNCSGEKKIRFSEEEEGRERLRFHKKANKGNGGEKQPEEKGTEKKKSTASKGHLANLWKKAG